MTGSDSGSKNLSGEFAAIYEEKVRADTRSSFETLLGVRDRCFEMIQAAIPLREDLKASDLREIPALDGGVAGNMRTYTGQGSPVDWIVRSWIGKPESGFTNMHLTCWLDETIEVPHLGMALGTIPDVFFYVDFVPRYEPVLHPEHLVKYHDSMNELWMGFRKALYEQAPAIRPFDARMPFIRSSLSPIALTGVVPLAYFQEQVEPHFYRYVERWIELVKAAAPVPEDRRAALRQRDLSVRRNIVELDPANVFADALVGIPLKERLIRILHAGERA